MSFYSRLKRSPADDSESQGKAVKAYREGTRRNGPPLPLRAIIDHCCIDPGHQ